MLAVLVRVPRPRLGADARRGCSRWRSRRSPSRRSASRSAASRARCARPRCSRSCSRCRSPRWRSSRRAPSNGTLYDAIRIVSGAFPFKPALNALDAALSGASCSCRCCTSRADRRLHAARAAGAAPLRLGGRDVEDRRRADEDGLALVGTRIGVAGRRVSLRRSADAGEIDSSPSRRRRPPRGRAGRLRRRTRCGWAWRGTLSCKRVPATRMRRLRKTGLLRGLVRETELSAAHLVYPMFVRHGLDGRVPIPSMPGIDHLSISAPPSRRPARRPRSASRPCSSSACRPRRTRRARAPGTTRASSSSPPARSRPPIPTSS